MARIRLFLLAVFLLATACGKAESPRGSTAASPAKEAVARKVMLEIRVDLAMDVAAGEDAARVARAAVDRAVAAGGYAESSTIDASGASLILRVPPAEIEGVRSVLGGYGPLSRETRSSRDVTDAVMDLDARTKSAKVEEARLLELLEHKTGNLADVLAVEKALADVRERIERLESEQRLAHGRVDLAVVAVRLNVRGAFDGAPLGQQLVLAGREGLSAARTVGILLATTTLRALPTLLMLAAVAFGVSRIVRRVRARA